MSRVVLVTGGTRGIGEAISLRLKEEGYKVAASYVSRDEDAQKFMKKTGVRVYKFDVAIFDQCSEKIKEIEKKNKTPILVGGTGLYFKALTDGLVKMPNIPLKIRNEIRTLQKKLGQKNFYNKLIKLDPLIKNLIDSNDSQRTIRAYEIIKYTKISMTKWFQRTKILFDQDRFIKFYIDFPRTELIERINKRVHQMFERGAIKEVKKFNRLKIKKENSANKIIGIMEITNYLHSKSSLNETKEQIVVKTRQYAKRQTTWARGQMMSWQKIEHKNQILALKKI